MVRAIYDHPWAHNRIWEEPIHTIPEYATPIGISLNLVQQTPQKTSTKVDSMYAALQKYFIVKVIECTELEVHQLQKEPSLQSCRSEDTGFSWNNILEFSFDAVQRVLMKVAPVMWMVLTSIAIGEGRSIQLKEANVTDKKSGKGLKSHS